MNIISKVITSLGNVCTRITTGISSSFITIATKYGVANPRDYEIKYGVATPDRPDIQPIEQSVISKAFSIGKIAIPVVLFIVGIVVLITKRISMKFKILIFSLLLLLSVIVYVLMDYISNLLY